MDSKKIVASVKSFLRSVAREATYGFELRREEKIKRELRELFNPEGLSREEQIERAVRYWKNLYKERENWTTADWLEELESEPMRNYPKCDWWRQAIYEKDNFSCHFCGYKPPERGYIYSDGLEAVWNSPYGLRKIHELEGTMHGHDPRDDDFFLICDNCRLGKGSPKDFEKFVGRLFEELGYTVKITGGTGDEGIDLMCTDKKNQHKIAVQCKRYKGKVGSQKVREFYGAFISSGADEGCIVTTGKFTEPAIKWSKGKPIKLINGRELHQILQRGSIHL